LQQRKLPRTIPRTDLHVHATRYRANPLPEVTVEAIVRRCEALSFDAVGVLDHLRRDESERPAQRFRELARDARAISSPMTVFVGAELNILDEEGSVTGSAEVKGELGLDYCMAAVHNLWEEPGTLERYMARQHALLMGAAENCDFAEVIAHPWRIGRAAIQRGLVERWRFSLIPQRYLEELIRALVRTGKAIEVNWGVVNSGLDPDYCEFLRAAQRAGVKLAVGSDAHHLEHIGHSIAIDEFLASIGFSAADIWTPRPVG